MKLYLDELARRSAVAWNQHRKRGAERHDSYVAVVRMLVPLIESEVRPDERAKTLAAVESALVTLAGDPVSSTELMRLVRLELEKP